MWHYETNHISLERMKNMKGRKPRLLSLSEVDKIELQKVVGNGKTEQRIARRARILLALSSPQTIVNEVAKYVQMTPTAIWQICRRYEERGIAAIYDAPRSGRPRVFSPPGESADRATCLLRTGRHRAGNDPLVNKKPGQGSSREGDYPKDSALYNLPGLEDSGSATPSQSVLENANPEWGVQASCKSYSLVLRAR
jgi:hypothetical protein